MTHLDAAVEAMTTLWPKGNPTQIEAQTLLSAAIPHLERHYREKLAEELRKEDERRAREEYGDSREFTGRDAADHLTREGV